MSNQNETAPIALPALPALPKMARTRKPKPSKPCECGCAAPTKGGRFVPGHDAVLHAWVLRVERGIVAEAPEPHTAAVQTLIAAKQAKTEAEVPTNVDPMVALQVAAADPETAPAADVVDLEQARAERTPSRQERKIAARRAAGK